MLQRLGDMAPTFLAGRVLRRLAAIGMAALIFGLAAFVVAEEQCDANEGGPLCPRAQPSAAEGVPAIVAPELVHVDNATSIEGQEGELPPEVGVVRLGFALLMLFSILAWLGAMLKFVVDGSLPARLALWGLLPEAYAAISVRAVFHLLRLKTGPTPVVVLRNCVTDDGARKLVEAMTLFGEQAELEAVELPHNPQLSAAGVKAIVDAALRPESKVMELDLSYNPQLGDAAVSTFVEAMQLKSSKIQVLRIADIGLSKAGLQAFGAAAGKSKLRVLDLAWNSMRGSGELVADIMDAPILEELVLTCCDLGVEDVAAVAEQLPYTSIRSLQLGGNRFGSEGVVQLCEHLAQCQVDELSLEAVGLEVGCEGLNALAAAWVARPFSRLRLHGNNMTNEEVGMFVKTLKSMQH